MARKFFGGMIGKALPTVTPSSAPSLDLAFDGTTSSFTRATTAADAAKANGDQLATSIVTQNKTGTVQSMYMGPDGKLIKGYVTNLVNNSEMKGFVGGAYAEYAPVTSGLTVTVNSDTDPAGGSSASLITPGASTTSYYAGDAQDYTAGTTYTFSSYFKVPSGSTFDGRVGFLLYGNRFNTDGDSSNIAVYWNLETDGTATFNSTSTTPPEDYGIIDVGNGWYRIWVTETCTTSATGGVLQYPRVTEITATTDTLLQWGAQVEEGAAPSELVRTTSGSVSDQVARVEYDASGNPLGLLVEEQRTNLLPNTEDLSNYSLLSGASPSPDTAVAPDGTTTADSLVENSASGNHWARYQMTVTDGTTYTWSVYVKASTSGRNARVVIGDPGVAFPSGDTGITVDLTDGSYTGGTALDASSVTDAGNGWWRVVVTSTAITDTNFAYFYVFMADGTATSYTGDGTSSIYVWGSQLEEGEGATSYIPNTATSGTVARLADDITLATSDFGVDPADATLAVEATLAQASSNTSSPRLYELHAGSNNDRNMLAYSDQGASAIKAQFVEGGATTTLLSASSVTYPFTMVHAQRREGASGTLAVDGTLGSSSSITQGSTTPTELVIGQSLSHGAQINGHIRRFTYWPRALSDEQLAEYTNSDIKYYGEDVTSTGIKNPGVLSLNEHYLFSK